MERHMEIDSDARNESTTTTTAVGEDATLNPSGNNENAIPAKAAPTTPNGLPSPDISITSTAATVEADQHSSPAPKGETRSSSSSSENGIQEDNAVCPNNEQQMGTAVVVTEKTNTKDKTRDDDSAICPHIEQVPDVSTDITPKQVYGMLCWLLMDDNVKQWRQEPLAACTRATLECPHLDQANPQRLQDRMKLADERRQQILEQHGGKSECVPRETRVCPKGPLFVIVDHVLSGNMTEKSKCAIGALIRVHAFGDTGTPSESTSASACVSGRGHNGPHTRNTFAEAQSNISSTGWRGTAPAICSGGPIRNRNNNREPNYLACRRTHRQGPVTHMQGSARLMQGLVEQGRLPNYKTLKQRAQRLTSYEINQMEDEMVMRREITLRDARLMADWVAMKRREFEMKELKIQEFIKAIEDETCNSLEQCEEYIRRLNEEL
ncbi:hypothetical protein H4R24_005455 [Coemansia sp. RSA 988]|nr:hypothetical protein H4R24_005455 [Coemansia sp. RSA 988]